MRSAASVPELRHYRWGGVHTIILGISEGSLSIWNDSFATYCWEKTTSWEIVSWWLMLLKTWVSPPRQVPRQVPRQDPDKPRYPRQKYLLTIKGWAVYNSNNRKWWYTRTTYPLFIPTLNRLKSETQKVRSISPPLFVIVSPNNKWRKDTKYYTSISYNTYLLNNEVGRYEYSANMHYIQCIFYAKTHPTECSCAVSYLFFLF